MTIRPATDQDLPLILALSKQSLGELGGIRTEEYWRWKHQQNPFGKSPVLLAFEGEKLIGLRAFMQWRFRYEGKTVQAFRAVDTATHPEHQGKGIFSKLTMALVDQLKDREPAIIFNTPNQKSMPGYIKMGWKEIGKTRLRVCVHPFNILQHQFDFYWRQLFQWRKVLRPDANSPAPIIFPDDIEALLTEWQNAHPQVVMTNYSLPYLQWRYQQIPMLHYGLKVSRQAGSTCLIIYRLKQSNSICELRLVEVFYTGPDRKTVVRTAIHELVETVKPDVTTVLADGQGELDALLPFGFFKADKRGLTITGRRVNDDGLEVLVGDYGKWSFTSGGLELF